MVSAVFDTTVLVSAFLRPRRGGISFDLLRLAHEDVADEVIIIETLKQRQRQVFRAVPVPRSLIPLLARYGVGKVGRLWP